MQEKQRLIVGISGASGIIYAVRLLEILKDLNIERHLVITKTAQITRAYETKISQSQLEAMADYCYRINDFSAPIASGSYQTMGMIVVPCSVRALAEIATGVATNLMTRAADVVLKERRRLVLLVREFPLHAGHLKNMLAVTDMGGIIAPPVPAFYTLPQTIDDIVNQTVVSTLDLFGLDADNFPRWHGLEKTK